MCPSSPSPFAFLLSFPKSRETGLILFLPTGGTYYYFFVPQKSLGRAQYFPSYFFIPQILSLLSFCVRVPTLYDVCTAVHSCPTKYELVRPSVQKKRRLSKTLAGRGAKKIRKRGKRKKKLRRAFFCHRESLMSLYSLSLSPLHSRTLRFLGSLYYVPTTLFPPIHPKIVPWAQPKATALSRSPFVLRFQFIFQYLASFLLIPHPPIPPTNSQKRLLGGRSMGDFLSEVGWGRTPPLPFSPSTSTSSSLHPASHSLGKRMERTDFGRGWRG